MTDQNTITRDRNQKVVKDFLGLLAAKNIEAWIELWADDGVQEMPYSPPGFPSRIEGKTSIHLHYSGLPDAYSRMAFPDLKIYPMLDPNWLLAEYRGEIDITATGHAYNNHYCALFHLRNYRIVLFKEYFNPIILSEAFGDTSSLEATFNLSGN
jgi:ketosteroid isomerase-like protein